MNVLCVVPFLTYPPDSGGAIRAYSLIRELSRQHTVSVITFGNGTSRSLQAWSVEKLKHYQALAISGDNSQVPTRRAVIDRMLSFPPQSFHAFPANTLVQAIDPVMTGDSCPDAIVFDTLMTGQAVLKQQWNVPMVLSLYDIASAYLKRIYLRTHWRPYKLVYAAEWLKTRHYERTIIRRFRSVIVVSAQNARAVQQMNPQARVQEIPNGVDIESFSPQDLQNNHDILFVGSFDYAPNAEALWFFYQNIWPQIRVQTNAQWWVVGRNPPADFVRAVQGDPRIQVAANVPDVRPYYARARVAIVPLLSGEGTRLKILESFAAGVPVVSTSVGCEGLRVADQMQLLIANDAESFTQAVLTCLNNLEYAHALARRARALVDAKYDWQAIGQDYVREIERAAFAK